MDQEQDSEQYEISINVEGNDYAVTVPDMQTALMLLNDQEAAARFIAQFQTKDLLTGVKDVDQDTQINVTPLIWSHKKPSQNDLDATYELLQWREKLQEKFDDKKSNKFQLWKYIADQLAIKKYNLGENPGERCRQKFANLTKTYLAYIGHQKKTGTGKNENVPPFFDELHSILGGKHKVNPPHLEDSLEQGQSEGQGKRGPISDAETNETLVEDKIAPSSSSHAAKDRFKNPRKKLKPASQTENVLKEMQAERRHREEESKFMKEHLKKSEEQRQQFLDILQKAFGGSKRQKVTNTESDSD